MQFCVISGHSLWGSYLFAEMQSVNSTTPTDWAERERGGGGEGIILNNVICVQVKSLFKRGAPCVYRGVMVTVVGNERGDTSSNPG